MSYICQTTNVSCNDLVWDDIFNECHDDGGDTGDDDGSLYKQTQFYVDSGDAISVECMHYPLTPEGNHLKINKKSLNKH